MRSTFLRSASEVTRPPPTSSGQHLACSRPSPGHPSANHWPDHQRMLAVGLSRSPGCHCPARPEMHRSLPAADVVAWNDECPSVHHNPLSPNHLISFLNKHLRLEVPKIHLSGVHVFWWNVEFFRTFQRPSAVLFNCFINLLHQLKCMLD